MTLLQQRVELKGMNKDNYSQNSYRLSQKHRCIFSQKSPVYIFAHVFFLRQNTGVSADPLRGGQTRPGESEEPPHPLAELTAERRHGNYEGSHILTLTYINIMQYSEKEHSSAFSLLKVQ